MDFSHRWIKNGDANIHDMKKREIGVVLVGLVRLYLELGFSNPKIHMALESLVEGRYIGSFGIS